MTTPNETPTSRLWRILFLATVIHFLIFGLIASHQVRQGLDAPELLAAFHPQHLGLLNAITLSIFVNSTWVMLALLAADVPALLLLWRLAHNLPGTRLAVIYLTTVLGAAVAHVLTVAYATSVGTFSTPGATYEASRDNAFDFAVIDLLLTLPAWTILAASLLLGRPRPSPGLCPRCHYDLRATSDRSPECGTPAPAAKAST